MAESSTSTRKPANRLKLALIPVLALALLGILSSSGDEAPAAMEDAVTSDSATAESVTSEDDVAQAVATAKQRKISWPQITLAGVLQHDPFALPPALSQLVTPAASEEQQQNGPDDKSASSNEESVEAAAAEDMQQKMAALQQRHVSVLLRSAKGLAAVIDSKVVHEGELLENGVRVVEIGRDGVILQIETP